MRAPEEPVGFRARDVLELQPRGGELLREVAKKVKKERKLERHVDAHVEKGLGEPEELRGAALEALRGAQDALRGRKELFARGRQDRGRAPHEELDAELALHARDVRRDHRLAAPSARAAAENVPSLATAAKLLISSIEIVI